GAGRGLCRRTRHEARRRVHRGYRGAAGQADGACRRDRHGLERDGGREGGGAGSGGRAGRADPVAGRRSRRRAPGRMSVAAASGVEARPDTRPLAWLLSGLRRGALLVFLPVFLAGQAIAWLTYAVSGWYRPWSWFKIGFAETLASVRVTFTGSSSGVPSVGFFGELRLPATLAVALGGLTVAVVVLAFRAGREQAGGLEDRP